MDQVDMRGHVRRMSGIKLFLLFLVLAVVAVPQWGFADSKNYAEKIEQLVGRTVFEKQLQNAQLDKMPEFISIRIYKQNAEIEVWGGVDDKSAMKLIKKYDVCAMDFTPGTKLKEGDERTPEGSFALKFMSNSKQWFMHIGLTEERVEKEGSLKDPSFYLCTDYPTKFDKELAKSIGVKKPGSAICLHGNCVSVGCASMVNRDFIEIYYWISKHQSKKFGAPRAHILPFRYFMPCDQNVGDAPEGYCRVMDQTSLIEHANQSAQLSNELSILGSEKLSAFWRHMAEREKAFIVTPSPENAELQLSMDIIKDLDTSKKFESSKER